MRTKFNLPVCLVVKIHFQFECDKYSGWTVLREQGDVLPCAVCGNYAETKTYRSPNGLASKDICAQCENESRPTIVFSFMFE
jgi:hypothetical protein